MTFLLKKMADSEEHRARCVEYLDTLEESVKEVCGAEVLKDWKSREAAWKRQVVNVREHHSLQNVYEVPEEAGK